MSDPTEAERIAMLQNAVGIYNQILVDATTTTTGLVARQDTMLQSVESDFAAEMLAGLTAQRAGYSSAYVNSALLDAVLRTWGKALNVPESAALNPTVIDAIYQWAVDNAKFFQTRGITFGSPTAGGGNTGNGVLYRVTKDSRGYPLEGVWLPDTWTARCLQDANLGARRNQEGFDFRAQYKSPDQLQLLGSGILATLIASPSDVSVIENPGFDRLGGNAAAPTDITKWTSSVAVNSTNYTFDETNIYLPRRFATEVRRALNVKVTATLTQRLDLTNRALVSNAPYLVLVRWNRTVGAATGTLELHWGSKSNSVVAAAQSGWQTLVYLATLDHQNAWYENQYEDQFDIKLVWTRTGGELLLDDIVAVPMERIGGTYWRLVSYSTPFKGGTIAGSTGDTFTASDVLAGVDGKIMRQLAHKYGRHMPTASGGSVNVADPS